MGIYAQTNFEIICDSNKSAKEVIKKLKTLAKKGDKDFNFTDISQLEIIKEPEVVIVYGFNSSGRIQNLEWQCEQIWKKIKNIKGVLEANFPILEKADGCWFSNEDNNK